MVAVSYVSMVVVEIPEFASFPLCVQISKENKIQNCHNPQLFNQSYQNLKKKKLNTSFIVNTFYYIFHLYILITFKYINYIYIYSLFTRDALNIMPPIYFHRDKNRCKEKRILLDKTSFQL